jgi:hypothetical protein
MLTGNFLPQYICLHAYFFLGFYPFGLHRVVIAGKEKEKQHLVDTLYLSSSRRLR